MGERLFEQRDSSTNSGQTSQFFLTFLDGIESTVAGPFDSGPKILYEPVEASGGASSNQPISRIALL